MQPLKAPYVYFGGKSAVAHLVWQRFGKVPNYVEPFFGSGAVLLMRPDEPGIETVNDACGFVANFWRALQSDPDAVAHHADWPVNENDLHARHAWLVGQKDSMQERLEGDPDHYDAKVAGWWCWGLACWIGRDYCSGKGPWRVVDGRLVRGGAGPGVQRGRVHLGDAGVGVVRKRVHLGEAGRGNAGSGEQGLYAWMHALAERLERTFVCCGDWSRVCGHVPTVKNGLTGVFLDPPYSAEAGRDNNLYRKESATVAHDVREWALSVGDDPRYRIALCGYEGEHAMPAAWECVAWKTGGGYGNVGDNAGRENADRERIWFSPHCLRTRQVKRKSIFEK